MKKQKVNNAQTISYFKLFYKFYNKGYMEILLRLTSKLSFDSKL